MEQLQLRFKPKQFNVGDQVVILSKSVGDPLGSGWAYWIKAGDVRRINSINIVNKTAVYTNDFILNNNLSNGDIIYVIDKAAFVYEDLKLAK